MPAVLSTQDRLDIHELLARYAWALDTADVEGFVGCFARDGELLWDSFETPLRWRGERALRRFIGGLRDRPESAGRQHFVANVVIEGREDGASARSYCLVTLRPPEGAPLVHVAGHYEDLLCLEDGTWRIRQRCIRDWAGPVLARFAGQTGERAARPRPPALDALLDDEG
jgi:hypothetical protein